DGNKIYEWVPRRTLKVRTDTRIAALPQLRVGAGVRWQSDVAKDGGAWQDSHALVDAFASYELSPAATLRLNAYNLTNKKYLRSVQYGAIYGAPRTVAVTLDYKL